MSQQSTPTYSSRIAGSNPYWQRAYAASSATESRALYDEWAAKYDQDVSAADYATPDIAAQAVVGLLGSDDTSATVLDAGCGTGLVGLRLRELRPAGLTVDGVDLSQKMLDVARRTGVYRDLKVADLSQRIEVRDGAYDVAVCVGTLTHGHVGPEVFPEFVRVVGKGGVVVATVLDEIWESRGYKGVVERLRDEGRVEMVRADAIGLKKGEVSGGRIVVLRKL